MRTYLPRIAHGLCSMVVVLLLAACGGGGDITFNVPPPPTLPGPFQMTFSLDDTFQGPHGGQPIRIALVRSSDNVTVAGDNNGTVSAILNPSFTFVTGLVMVRGTDYAVHYYIDNTVAGIQGVCDPITIDPQWSREYPSVANDKDITESYVPAQMEDVCSTFPP